MRVCHLLCLVGLLAACGKNTQPSQPETPHVTLSPVPREVVGTKLDFTVAVTGCTKIARVWVTDGPDLDDWMLAEQEGGSATNTLSSPSKHVDYKTHGVPAALSVYAHATCAPLPIDGGTLPGNSGTSDPQPVLFMPAEEVVPGPVQFGKNYWSENSDGVFLTCDRELRRVDKSKKTLGTLPLPFDCATDAELWQGGDGNRYLLKPGVGVVGFDDGLQKTLQLTGVDLRQVAAPASGVLAALAMDGILYQMRGYDPKTGELAWAAEDTDLQPAGHIVFNRLGQVVLPGFKAKTGSEFVDLGIEVYDAKTGDLQADRAFGIIKIDPLSVTPIPTISFDQSGEVAYFAEIADPSRVWCCSAVDNATCTDMGKGLKWRSASLPGGVHTVTRTSSAVVAFGKVAYFLDPLTGTAITPVSTPIRPRSGLVFAGVLGGKDGSTYLLAQGVDGSGRRTGGIKQVLVFDAQNKLVSDFLTSTEGFIVKLDPVGRAWLWRDDLTLLKLASEYSAMLR
jgi:hypothetical protein